MGGEMEVVLDELAAKRVDSKPSPSNPPVKNTPTTGCPPDSYLNAEMASRGREGRA